MHTMLRICQRAPTFKNQEMYTIRYSYPMLRCNACTTWPQDAASDTATQCKNSMTLHTSHTMTCLDEVALARLNALNILTQIFEKKDDSSRSGYDRITAQGGHPCHPCLLVQCLFHIVEDLPSPHQSIQDICLEPASSQIPRVWLLWAWISRSVTQVLANLMKLSSVHFRFSPTMQGSRTEYGWPYHASSNAPTHNALGKDWKVSPKGALALPIALLALLPKLTHASPFSCFAHDAASSLTESLLSDGIWIKRTQA